MRLFGVMFLASCRCVCVTKQEGSCLGGMSLSWLNRSAGHASSRMGAQECSAVRLCVGKVIYVENLSLLVSRGRRCVKFSRCEPMPI